ncbi:FecR family protein [Aquimarina sp. RZ0]|uniref:FecR family protein n=1 Tax=Aquimarina sp. RZ0 TaxID=2607730 RepID=UPI0011F1DF6B|nr:FecR family protein [Aquimarina sp. RZ0]KAA1245760.1 FecR family protein [Aquimarina sp. RZ0]
MKKEDLTKKWLNNDQLTKQESETFMSLDVFDSYVKISETAKKFKAPVFNVEENFQELTTYISSHKNTAHKNMYKVVFLRIAAIFVVVLGVYFAFINEYNTSIKTLAAEKKAFELPGASSVNLNAGSTIVYNEKKWKTQRKLTLDGEAFFKVAKGKKFEVHTSSGIVTVLGTQFNVKQRDHYFEVRCYEGLVRVTFDNNTIELPPGNLIKVIDGSLTNTPFSLSKPDWTENRSSFVSVPFSQIIEELERQYNITVTTKNVDPTILFTGNFVHSDIQTAVQSITIPMRLNYTINHENVTLYKE